MLRSVKNFQNYFENFNAAGTLKFLLKNFLRPAFKGMFYYVYILQSQKNNSLYIGYTSNLKKRLKEHNSGLSQATKPLAPYELIFYEAFIPFNFKVDDGKKIYNFLKDRPALNAGFIIGPTIKFIKLCKEMDSFIINKNAFGPDQVALNYFIYQDGVKLLDRKYNFMISNVRDSFVIKDGCFYFKNGEKIVVVHNAGRNWYLRSIINFGYGKNFNQLNFLVYYFKRSFFRFIGFIKSLFSQ